MDLPVTEPTAGEVLAAAVRELARQFEDTEDPALAAHPDGVHRHRTSVRRLRSVLRVFRDLLDPYAAAQLRALLDQWGSALGVVRDHEVAAELAEAMLGDVPAAGSDPAVARELVESQREAAAAAHRRVLEIHELPRQQEMRRLLHEFAADPPLSPAAAAPASTIRKTLLRNAKVVLRDSRGASRSLESYHTLRKHARRLHHAVDAATTDPPGLFGDRLRRVGKLAHRIQSQLGDHRDALLLVTRIERARVLAGRAGEDVSPYDELTVVVEAFAEDALQQFHKTRKKFKTAVDAVAR